MAVKSFGDLDPVTFTLEAVMSCLTCMMNECVAVLSRVAKASTLINSWIFRHISVRNYANYTRNYNEDQIVLFMAALCNRVGHIYFHPVVSSFFPRLISAVGDWMSTILWHTSTHGVALV